jgi:hypothetical protein
MKNKRNQDKMVFGTAAVGTTKIVRSVDAVLVIENIDAHLSKPMKK